MTTVAVIGAGVMGSGIAQVMAMAGSTVRCQDISADQLDAAHAAVRSGRYGVDRSVELGKCSPEDAVAALDRLSFTTSLEEAASGADFVIEAVPEHLALKLRLFQDLDSIVGPDTVLASNSSGLPIVAFAAVTRRPEHVLGWHWASPPVAMKLAEIVVHGSTSEDTVARVKALAVAAGKNPVVVRENPMVWGYVANRIMAAAVREASAIVREGLAAPEQIDQLLRDAYRWPAGVFGIAAGATSGWSDSAPATG